MKKIFRVLIIVISSAIILYGLFVGVECVRLYNADISRPPIITTSPPKTENDTVKYTGLGYTITYRINEKVETEENASLNSIYDVCGAEFRLFDKILLWAWIEDADVQIEKFSYKNEASEFDEIDWGVKTNDFQNTENIEINNQTQAVELAKNEVTVEYDSVSVAFDKESEMWKVIFFKKSQLGGGQTVYLNKDGITQLCVWGE